MNIFTLISTSPRNNNQPKGLMNHLGRLLFLSVLITGFLFTSSTPQAYAGQPVQISSAKNANTNTLSARAIVNAPPEVVWKTMTNYNNLSRILPGYKKSKLLSSAGSTKTVDFGLKVNALLPTYNYKCNIQENRQGYRLNLKRVSGDFNSLDASYKLQPMNGGKQTMILYKLAIDPGTKIPGTTKILENNTKDSLAAIQKHVEQQYQRSVIGTK